MIHGFAVGNTNSGGGGGGITAINISAGTTSSNTAAVTFADGNGISFGYDGSNITATVQTNYLTTAMASNRGSDFVQATAAFHGTNASGTINSNNISVSVNATVAQTVQTQNCVDISLSGNTSGALALISSGTAILAGGNNITLSQNGQSVTISGANTVAQTVQTQNCVDISLSGNTSGALALISSGTAILAGGNNITLSQNGQSVTISAFNQSVQTQNLVDVSLSGNTTGTLTLVSSGTVILAGGNNITLSQNGQSITISAFNQSVQTQNNVDISLAGNTTGTLTLISSGTAILAGGNNITLSQNGQSVTISCGAAGTGFTTASTAGSNIVGTLNTAGLSMGVPNYLTTETLPVATLSLFENIPDFQGTVSQAFGVSRIEVLPFLLPQPISAGYIRLFGSMSMISSSQTGTTANSTFTMNNSYSTAVAIYTQGTGANSLSLRYSTSTVASWMFQTIIGAGATGSQYTVTFNITYPTQGTTSGYTTSYATSDTRYDISTGTLTLFTGAKYFDIPFAQSITPGNYWFGFGMSAGSAQTGQPTGLANGGAGFSCLAITQATTVYGFPGVASNSSNQIVPGLGSWTTNAALMSTSSVGLASISFNSVNNPKIAFQIIRQA